MNSWQRDGNQNHNISVLVWYFNTILLWGNFSLWGPVLGSSLVDRWLDHHDWRCQSYFFSILFYKFKFPYTNYEYENACENAVKFFLQALKKKNIKKRQIIHGRFVSLAPLERASALLDWSGNCVLDTWTVVPGRWDQSGRASQYTP